MVQGGAQKTKLFPIGWLKLLCKQVPLCSIHEPLHNENKKWFLVCGICYTDRESHVFLRQQSTLSCIYGNLQGILHATDTRLTQATCHTSCKSHSWIQRGMSCREKFVATKIIRPTHLFFYLWDNLKAKVYANNPKTLEGQYSEWNWSCVASMTTWRRVKKSIHAQGNHFQHQI